MPTRAVVLVALALAMGVAGVAWAAYSLLGRSSRADPVFATSMSFTRAVPFAALLFGAAFVAGSTHWRFVAATELVVGGVSLAIRESRQEGQARAAVPNARS